MPHQCTTCGRTFADGSKEMLGGCPGCGGNKFQFLPSGAVDDPAGTGESGVDADVSSDPAPGPPADGSDPGVADHGADAAAADDADSDAAAGDREDRAQASARGAMATPDELPPVEAETAEESHEDRPDIAALREELNDQFESIKIVEPGQYELNLMELYDRQEYIVAIEEDGRYVIDVPSVDFEDPERD